MVNRYTPHSEIDISANCVVDPDGPFVLYADYEKLKAALTTVQATSIAHAGEQNARIAQLEAALRTVVETRNWLESGAMDHVQDIARQALAPPSTLCAVCDQIKELHPKSHEWTPKPQHDPGCNSWGQMMYAGHYPCSCGLSK